MKILNKDLNFNKSFAHKIIELIKEIDPCCISSKLQPELIAMRKCKKRIGTMYEIPLVGGGYFYIEVFYDGNERYISLYRACKNTISNYHEYMIMDNSVLCVDKLRVLIMEMYGCENIK